MPYILQNTKEDILKSVGAQTVLNRTDFHFMDKQKWRRFSKYILFLSVCVCVCVCVWERDLIF